MNKLLYLFLLFSTWSHSGELKLTVEDSSNSEFYQNYDSGYKPFVINNKNGISINDDKIQLTLKYKTIELKNKPRVFDEDDFNIYKYLGYIPTLNSYLIKHEQYEADSYMIINGNNGKIINLDSMPIISSDTNYIFTITYDPYENYDESKHEWSDSPAQNIKIYKADLLDKNIYEDKYFWGNVSVILGYWYKDVIYLKLETDNSLKKEEYRKIVVYKIDN
ncbi:MAG: hypothetical protein LBN41_09845 [Enterobacteriaceae bacterium]|jgi:hypothetical protein|nr:hypothetical protein [Enterobacteriaceae bacterium]